MTSEIHPNLKMLTSTATPLLHGCPRRYELTKLTPKTREDEYEETDEHLHFGDVVGTGVQEYLVTSSIERTYLTILMAWKQLLDDDTGERSRKTFWHALHAMDRFVALRNTALAGFELAYINGEPAVELGYAIDCGDGFTYRSFIDAVLINRFKNELTVYEGKTTKNKNIHEAQFKHSGQGLGYSIVLDTIAKQLGNVSGLSSSFKVRYVVYKTYALDWEMLVFTKNLTQRALWIKNLLLDIERIKGYAADNYFPMHGEYCYSYFRPCTFFGTCELSNKFLIGDKVPVNTEDPKNRKIHFRFNLSDIIDAQLAMTESTP